MKSDPNMHRAQKRPNQSADTSTATVGGVGQIFFEKIWDRSESMNVLRMANGKNPWRLAGRQSGEDGERRLAGAQLHGPNNPNPSTRGNEAQLNCVSLRSPLDSQGRGELSGRIWLLQEGMDSFAGDLSEQEKKLVWATQCVPAPDLFAAKAGGTARKSKPSWYIVAKNDRTIQPDCERFLAKRMGATTTEVASSHVVMLSQPQVVIDVIRKAVKAAQGVKAAA